MSNSQNNLGKIARSGTLAITTSPQNLATLIANDLNIDRDSVFYVSVIEGVSDTFVFHYGPDSTVTKAFNGADYQTLRAEVVNNAHDLWIDGNSAMNIDYIVYVDEA